MAEQTPLDLVQRVVLPSGHDPAVLPLYVDADSWTMIPLPGDRSAMSAQRGFVHEDNDRAVVRLPSSTILEPTGNGRGLRIPERRTVSFGAYFNAFPAAYWQKWTTLDRVVLSLTTSGPGQVLVYRSSARGVAQKVDAVPVEGESTLELPLKLSTFTDGGWYWFDLVAGDEELTLRDGGWYAPAGSAPTRGRPGSTSIAITTLNREEYCSQLLADIGAHADILKLIDRVYVVDQGSRRIADAAGFPEAQAVLGDKLRVIEQANLGGSGGFARGMYETLRAGESDNVLLLDDDIAIEPESIRRALKFNDYLVAPAIVGGHMFDMNDRSKLLAFAEGVDTWNFMWGPTTPTGHDFGASNLRQTRWLHRRVDAGYNGWWMSMIPVEVLREVGLSLPVFIKWDDAEYSLRAAAHGYPTVTLPGAAVWHVSWMDKDDSQDWQAFYHARNRLVAALLHSPHEKGGRLTRDNLALDLKHLLSMQYFAAAARYEAYESVLAGPDSLVPELPTRLPRLRALAQKFSDGVALRPDDLPEVAPGGPPASAHGTVYPSARETMRWLPRMLRRHYLQPASADDMRPPQIHLAYTDGRWWVTPHYDSLLVTNADGSAVLWHRRDRRLFRSGLWRSVRYRQAIRRRWADLAERYRAALPDLVSPETWERTFFP